MVRSDKRQHSCFEIANPDPGTVHITSSDPTQHPRIDPGYFRNPADVKIMAEGIKWMTKVADRPVLKKSLGERILPPEGASIESEEERSSFVRDHISVSTVSPAPPSEHKLIHMSLRDRPNTTSLARAQWVKLWMIDFV